MWKALSVTCLVRHYNFSRNLNVTRYAIPADLSMEANQRTRLFWILSISYNWSHFQMMDFTKHQLEWKKVVLHLLVKSVVWTPIKTRSSVFKIYTLVHVNIAIVIRILSRNVFHWCIGEIDHILLMRAFFKCSGNWVLPSSRATNPADQIMSFERFSWTKKKNGNESGVGTRRDGRLRRLVDPCRRKDRCKLKIQTIMLSCLSRSLGKTPTISFKNTWHKRCCSWRRTLFCYHLFLGI